MVLKDKRKNSIINKIELQGGKNDRLGFNIGLGIIATNTGQDDARACGDTK